MICFMKKLFTNKYSKESENSFNFSIAQFVDSMKRDSIVENNGYQKRVSTL